MDAMTLQCRVRTEVRTPKTDSPKSSTVTPELLPNPKGNMEAKECPFLLFASTFHTFNGNATQGCAFKGGSKENSNSILT